MTWALVISALGVVVVRRRSVAIVLVALQSLRLGVHAISDASRPVDGAAGRRARCCSRRRVLLPALLCVVVPPHARGASDRDRAPPARAADARARGRARRRGAVPRFGLLADAGVEHAAVGLRRAGDRDRDRAPPGDLPGARLPGRRERPLSRGACRARRAAGVHRARPRVRPASSSSSVAAAFSAKIHEELGTGDTTLLEACVIDALAIAVARAAGRWRPARPARPHAGAAADRVNVAGASSRPRRLALDAGGRRADAQRAPTHGSWYVLDGATGRVPRRRRRRRAAERARLARVPRRRTARACFARAARAPGTTSASICSGRRCSRCRWSTTSASPGCWSRRRPAPRRCWSPTAARRNALEAGWKYLVLTTFGLTIALVGILVLYVGLAPHGGVLATLDWQQIAAPRARSVPADVRCSRSC